MGVVTGTPDDKDRMTTPIYADILGRAHDTKDMAHAASYEFLLAEEMRELAGVPQSPDGSPEIIALRWFAQNRDSAADLMLAAIENLSKREVFPTTADIAVPA